MRATYHHPTQTARIHLVDLNPGCIATTVEALPGVNIALNAEGCVVGIELIGRTRIHAQVVIQAREDAGGFWS